MDINEIINLDDSTALGYLKDKQVKVPDWFTLSKDYYGKNHRVMDRSFRRDKELDEGRVEGVSRIYIELEKIIVSRMTEFMFAIPVKRLYNGVDDDEQKEEISKAIESIYNKARIDSCNIDRARKFFATCEICTLWYASDTSQPMYGINANKKLKLQTYSPEDGYKLYPLFDNYGDMIAMTIEYSYQKIDGTADSYTETYTALRHVRWKNGVRELDEENPLGKIPMVYMNRKEAIYSMISHLRDEIELTLSRNSDVISYNSAPILQVAGDLIGDSESKDTSKRILRVENGGSVSYVDWKQSIDSIKFQVSTLLEVIWMLVQLPDLSFDKLKGLGMLSGEAMKVLLSDAHLKVGDEKGVFLEMLDREANIIKEYLANLKPDWREKIYEIEIEHIITPFVHNDDKSKVELLTKATGGKSLMSQLEAIEYLGMSANPNETYNQIKEEDLAAQNSQVLDIFQGAE